MNYDDERPPPLYTDVVENPNRYPSDSRAAAYVVPISREAGNVKYTSPNTTNSNTNEIQFQPLLALGQTSVECTCTNCHSLVKTRVKHTSGLLVWLLAIILFFLGCVCGCCLIPFCVPEIKNIQHYCPRCKVLLGEYRRL
ncbi:unnamed protein product [Rotaria magnacalcarata]|uniref:LITAF domain-containing protein n=1 Tax=Rotaria magnacalcarata TaxID=392030 RepID=A0A819EG45_9BILA|nr:unnamed protein product [Rotaria magnacalcarata]CAF1587975.1 unnamed protein product [Rotaria magnacalcarata]CAF2103110.1 unnamed protein product [Rotaria magnacalcarata]CAF3849028.1 unnamed protein product [Rotaria magnacalcarata]CAF3995330.1 unnamed protein product [Rotaria magnacalcarata]